MITPSQHHMEGFFHGMEHALALAEGRKRGKLSAQSHAIRTELVHLRMAAQNQTCEASAQRSLAAPVSVASTGSAQIIKKLISAAAGVLMLCLFCGLLTVALGRAIVIESDWRHDRLCKHSAMEVNLLAIEKGAELPCP